MWNKCANMRVSSAQSAAGNSPKSCPARAGASRAPVRAPVRTQRVCFGEENRAARINKEPAQTVPLRTMSRGLETQRISMMRCRDPRVISHVSPLQQFGEKAPSAGFSLFIRLRQSPGERQATTESFLKSRLEPGAALLWRGAQSAAAPPELRGGGLPWQRYPSRSPPVCLPLF